MQVVNSRRLLLLVMVSAVIIVFILATAVGRGYPINKEPLSISEGVIWQVPDTSQIPFTDEGLLIRYGRELIANTSFTWDQKEK